MPKDKKHIATVQKHRKKVKEKLSRYVPGKVTLQVLGTGAIGAPRSLYMFSDQSRYLFNCGEGTQRLAHEHKMKLAKLEHIFVTQPVWRNIGGLPGIALTIQDVGVPEITLHGPPGLNNIFAATKRFIVLKNLNVNMAKCDEDTVFSDNVMTMHYVPLYEKKVTEVVEIVKEVDTIKEEIESTEKLEKPEAPQNSPQEEIAKECGIEAVVNQFHASTSTRREKKRKRSSVSADSKANSGDEFNDNTDYYAYERKKKDKEKVEKPSRYCYRSRPRSRSVDSAVKDDELKLLPSLIYEQTKVKGISMAYICILKPRPGALNLDKCLRMGVRPGPLLGRLKAGEDVKLVNGKIVTAKDVCEPDDPGLIFIVVDCPTVDYLDSLHANEMFKKHQKTAEYEKDIASVVIHFTPQEIVNHPRYQEWMEAFPTCTTQLMLNEFNTCMGSEAVHRIQYKLNLLSPDIFPILGDNGSQIISCDPPPNQLLHKKPKLADSCTTFIDDEIVTKLKHLQRTPTSPTHSIKNLMETAAPKPSTAKEMMICPRTFCTYHLRPKRGLDRSMELTLNPHEYINESLNVQELMGELRKLKIKMLKKTNEVGDDYPKLLFLGTGSCIPNKTRNTSGILVSLGYITRKQHILLDCGEGTYGQIIRFFGQNDAHNILANLDSVYISHLHADHHIGLLGILQGRKQALSKLNIEKRPLYLFAPKQIMTWLSFYDRCFESIMSEFELVPNDSLMQGGNLLTKVAKNTICDNLYITDINTCAVRHCPNAFGVSIICRNGYKLTYSGDTMPSDSLVNLGIGSHILIHEATMEDELCHEATLKMHSTTNQAICIGKRMRAKHIILTHFSQRYAKLPRFSENFGANVGIAFDNMHVGVSDLTLIPELYPALRIMFAEHYEELENKALKRQVKEAKRKLS
ncbi:unnamed protein product [Psylliodes chrysocephalus]|uniref:Zinc phosphodiesterase ELAC protein 2 n=1 Tax=Psylliodes chrysocephalus TaxID=3402493 RepID=A0A9P0GBC6_9CUCU|nr:unnamed protein product [Psylliodes chrysocephala]